jgi:hypothetical protein
MTVIQQRFIRLMCALCALALLAAGAVAMTPTGVTTVGTSVSPNATATVTPAVTTPTTVATTATVATTVSPIPTVTTTTVAPTATLTGTTTLTVPPTVTAPTTQVGGALNVVRTPGATVFIGENGLDITAAGVAAGETLGWFQAGANVQTSSPDDTLTVSNPSNFYVQPGTRVGAWYNMNRNRQIAINVKDPSLNVRVWGVQTSQDLNGRTVTKGRLLTFRIDSNLDAVFTQRGVGAPVTIKVQDPSGNVYASLIDDTGAQNPIVDIPITSSSMLVPGQGANGTVWDTANRNYRTGEYKVWAESNLNRMKDNYKDPSGADYTGKTITSQYTLTIGQDTLSIETNAGTTVTRNQDFAVIVNGQPNTAYALWLSGTSSLTGAETPPRIKEGQAGVTPGDAAIGALVYTGTRTVGEDVPPVPSGAANPYYARVVTDDNGRRTIGFSTNQSTREQSYTVRIQTLETTTASKYDTLSLDIAKGGVTVSAATNQSFFLGEEIRLEGTNSDSETTYLFLTGPNLPSGGARLTDIEPVVSGDATTFTSTEVDPDNTWEYRWATAGLNLDAGSYTVYAVSSPNNRDNLGGTQYGTFSVVVRKPFVTANASGTVVARGDPLTLTGTAEGNPTQGVAVWLFGTNYYSRTTQTVNDDTSFSHEIARGTTQGLATGQYFAVVQHPMYNGQFDVDEVIEGGVTRVYDTSGNFFVASGPGRLQGSDAADALTRLLDGQNIDDTYTKMTFAVEEASITIEGPTDIRPGGRVNISGTTNLAPGDVLQITITSSAFSPTNKSQGTGFSGTSGQTTVQRGEAGRNTFSFAADTSQLQPDTYQVTVESVDAGVTRTATFRVTTEAGGTVAPTTSGTVGVNVTGTMPIGTSTGVTTIATTATGTATPTRAPGFGTLVAVIGLIAVAVLVCRKR